MVRLLKLTVLCRNSGNRKPRAFGQQFEGFVDFAKQSFFAWNSTHANKTSSSGLVIQPPVQSKQAAGLDLAGRAGHFAQLDPGPVSIAEHQLNYNFS